jgi:protein SCO1/2
VRDGTSSPENVSATARAGAGRPPAAGRATAGAVVPDLPLVDQNGTAMKLRDAAGRVLVVTFLYTRCPMPEMCPLVVKHLETVRRRANEEGLGNRLALLGVSLDPAFDTPAVLHAYGESVLKASNRFGQWTLATGTAAQIENVARFFGIGYRSDGGIVTHTLSTAVVSHDGRIIRIFGSNSWRPDDLFDVVRGEIERAAMH